MIISRSIHDAEGALVLSCPEGLIKRQWSYPVTISTVQIQNPGTEKLWWGLLLRCTVLRIQLKWLGVEAQIQSLAQCSGLKDLVLLQLWCRSQLHSDSILGPWQLPYAMGVAMKKKIKKKRKEKLQWTLE